MRMVRTAGRDQQSTPKTPQSKDQNATRNALAVSRILRISRNENGFDYSGKY